MWQEWDYKIFFLINRDFVHPWLDAFFPWWTDFQKTPVFWGLLPLLLIGVWWKGRGRALGVLLMAFLVASIADIISAEMIKPLFERSRPEFSEMASQVLVRGPSAGGFSFPSSHALDAFALVAFLISFYPRGRWYFLGIALLTAYSRVYCGLHFPSDVLGGALLGFLFGFSMAEIWKRFLFFAKKRVGKESEL
ncbi:MAG: phosphatase PAP2 family protein [Bdellovibrio sp.]